MSPETYVGYDRLQYLARYPKCEEGSARRLCRFPASLSVGELALSGTWTVHAQEATAGSTQGCIWALPARTSTW